ncbi:uncharacterized protein LOC143033536 [Oratosquilla oratoria]|uniref:uncharacterized protein LOC143033536 n=1 Tax=Oratosquilla oratoria TaxID=337810 RepID=UPI003F757735
MIASLEVENLFTNISVDRTIQYITFRVYHNNDTSNCDIPESVMKKLLECCTKEVPFTCPRGTKYCQIDGVAMGSPLGVLFTIFFFMGRIEKEVFDEVQRPRIHCRYIDDIFVMTEDIQQIEALQRRFKEASGLNFTIEHSNEDPLPFLDVLVKQEKEAFNTSAYVKSTSQGHSLNGSNECPQRYKGSTIGAFIRKALTHYNNWRAVHSELERATYSPHHLTKGNPGNNTEILATHQDPKRFSILEAL